MVRLAPSTSRNIFLVIRLAGTVFLFLLFLSGCVTNVELRDTAYEVPESLQIDDRKPKTILGITIQNGQGETLYEGKPGKGNADPPLDQLDGTMTITHGFSDGTTETFTVNHEPKQHVTLDWNSALHNYEVKEPGPFNFWVNGGFGSLEATRFGIGTIIGGGIEKSFALSDDRISTTVIEGGISYDLTDTFKTRVPFRTSLYANYEWGDDSTTKREPVGGNALAVTYDKKASNNSTGVAVGATGGTAESQNEVSLLDVGIRAEADYPLGENGAILTPNVHLSYRGFWQEGWGGFTSATFPGIYSDTDQDLDDHYYGVGTGLQLNYTCEETDIRYSLGGNITGYWRETDLDSKSRYMCDLCPPAEQDFTVRVTDKDDGFTFGLEANAGIEIPLIYDATFGVFGTARYLEERGAIVNKENPSQPTKRVVTDDAFDWTVRTGISLKF